MLDINYIRKNANQVKQNIINRGADQSKADVDKALQLDDRRKEVQQQLDDINQKRNNVAGKMKQPLADDQRQTLIAKGKELKLEAQKLEDGARQIKADFEEVMAWIPNMLSADVSVGQGEDENDVIKAWRPDMGYLDESKLKRPEDTKSLMPEFPPHADQPGFEPLHHVDLGKQLDVIDVEQSAKVSGSRFTYLKGDLVLMQYAIEDLLRRELLSRGFTPVIPPNMVREGALFGTSHFPADAEQIYKIDTDGKFEETGDVYLVGSSEPSLFAYHMDRMYEEKDLPIKYFTTTTCYRSEVGSWGKDVRGIKRLHQFDKLEMDVIATPARAVEVYEELLSINEWLLQQLKLPYHLVQKCSGDAGYYASHKQCDPEVWLAGQQEFMEVGTDTNATDYQARRLNIRFKNSDGKKEYVHTINDTGCAFGRMLIAIMDNYQQADGSILVPEVLQEYVGKERIGG